MIEAAILNASPEETTGPDVMLFSGHGGNPAEESPRPSSNSIWNDSLVDNGYDEEAVSADGADPELLDLDGKNKLWVRINNGGNRPTAGQITAFVYIKDAYTASVQDLDPANWTAIGTIDFGSSPMASGAFAVKGLIWNPADVLTIAYRNDLLSVGHAFFRVVVTYSGSERRLNNNAALRRVGIR